MKIYTKTGDAGETSLFGGVRFKKSLPVFEILGTIDELNAALGFVANSRQKLIAKNIAKIQNTLFELGSVVANEKLLAKKNIQLESDTKEFEFLMDKLDKNLPALTNFILPGGTTDATHLHLARTICRRLERQIISSGQKYAKSGVLMYVNRLSDVLFVLARHSNKQAKKRDVVWKKRRTSVSI
jgi:cob(I)alamin adenosyltransferase